MADIRVKLASPAKHIEENIFFLLSIYSKSKETKKTLKAKTKKSIFFKKYFLSAVSTCLVHWQRHPSEEEDDGSDRLEDPVGAEEGGHGGVVGAVDNVPFEK